MSRATPPLESLRVFDACARNLSLTLAGAELGLTQPAVSQRIRDLEAELGVQLFLRTRPKLTLTDAGWRLAEPLARALAQLRAAVNAVSERPLRVTAAPTFASRWLAPRLSQAVAASGSMPKIEVDTSTNQEPLGAGGYDVGFRYGTGNWPGLTSMRIFPFEWTPMLSPALAAQFTPQAHASQLLRATLLPSHAWERWFIAAGLTPPDVTAFNIAAYPTQEVNAQAAMAGVGVALLTPRLFRRELESGHLIRPFVLSVIGPEAYYAVFDDTHSHPGRATFLGWLADEAGPHERDSP